MLTPIDAATARIVRRARANADPLWFWLFALFVVFVRGEAINARKLLRGVQRRAEATHPVPDRPDPAVHPAPVRPGG